MSVLHTAVFLRMRMGVYDVGIGLTSVRGTGTSGYVQTNKFNLRGGPDRGERERKEGSQKGHVVKANKDIIDHNRKRELEVKVMEYRIQLEDEEYVCDGCIVG